MRVRNSGRKRGRSISLRRGVTKPPENYTLPPPFFVLYSELYRIFLRNRDPPWTSMDPRCAKEAPSRTKMCRPPDLHRDRTSLPTGSTLDLTRLWSIQSFLVVPEKTDTWKWGVLSRPFLCKRRVCGTWTSTFVGQDRIQAFQHP